MPRKEAEPNQDKKSIKYGLTRKEAEMSGNAFRIIQGFGAESAVAHVPNDAASRDFKTQLETAEDYIQQAVEAIHPFLLGGKLSFAEEGDVPQLKIETDSGIVFLKIVKDDAERAAFLTSPSVTPSKKQKIIVLVCHARTSKENIARSFKTHFDRIVDTRK